MFSQTSNDALSYSNLIIVPSALGEHSSLFARSSITDAFALHHDADVELDEFVASILHDAGGRAALLQNVYCLDTHSLPGEAARRVETVKRAAVVIAKASGARLLSVNYHDAKTQLAAEDISMQDAVAVAAGLECLRRRGAIEGEIVRRSLHNAKISELAALRGLVAPSVYRPSTVR